jgi:cobalt/nickel transport system permease protein
MAAVLFGKSYQRAEGLHHAMLSRGFRGDLPVLERARFTLADAAILAAAAVCGAGTALWP